MAAQNRKRPVQLIVRVTEDEKALIYRKMAQIPTKNLAAYARKMLIDGYIINVDYSEVKDHAAQLGRISGNINQVVRRMNETGGVYAADIAEIKHILPEIWKSERRLYFLCCFMFAYFENAKYNVRINARRWIYGLSNSQRSRGEMGYNCPYGELLLFCRTYTRRNQKA